MILEKAFLKGETLREGTHLYIESELNIIKDTRTELRANYSSEKAERKTMKELGLERLEKIHRSNEMSTYIYMCTTSCDHY